MTDSQINPEIINIEGAAIVNNCLWGYPKDHPGCSNTKLIRTSRVISVDGDLVETANSIYKVLSWQENQFKLPS